MYLQSLELLGFKSFAQKTVLNFDKGVTAVVGPNGCGKSNVLDAMRWVLGEQSAKALRGGEMADVIFSGTDSRQALGMAEVSMTFAECEKELGVDWNEVRITRRVFRDGGSEYLLNKTPCRLRDIHNLFMDTGIGRSAYSIMEQGKIDLILSSRPEDRRAIFEEAAGITKYKYQKKEALRKLEATEANLLRVTDIVKEVKRQIGSLQRQAAKARRYQTLISDLKTLDTHLSRRQFDQLDATFKATAEEITKLGEAQESIQLQVSEQESESAAQRQALEALEERLNVARHTVQDFKNQIQSNESRISFNAERVQEFTSLIQRYQIDVDGAEEKVRIQETQLQNTDLELEQIIQSLQVDQQHLDTKAQAVNAAVAERSQTEASLQSILASLKGIENRVSALRGEIAGVINQRDGSEARLGILVAEIEQLNAAHAGFEARKNETTAQLEADQIALAAHEQEVRLCDEQSRATQAELAQVDTQLAEAQRVLAEKDSKLEVLRQLNEEGEGFAAGTQAVLHGLDNPELFKPAMAGVLAAHIQVGTEFITAIESALGQNLQAIVMKDTTVAESIVQTLSTKKLGRASLALREYLPSSSQAPSQALPQNAIGWAVDKVQASEEARPLVAALLKNVVLVPDLATALAIRAQNPSTNLQLLTLAGELLSAEGILLGGQTGEVSSSMLHRKNQIAQLEIEANAAQARITEVAEQRRALAEQLEAAQARLAGLRQEAQEMSVTVSTRRNEVAQIEREIADTATKLQNQNWERGNVESRHSEAVTKLQDLEGQIASAGGNQEELHAQQSQLQATLESLRASEAELAGELSELRIKVATERQRHNSLNSQREPMAARLIELGELIAQRRSDIEGYEIKIDDLRAESARIAEEIEVIRSSVSEAEAALSGLLAERAGIHEGLEAVENTLRILRRQAAECSEQRGKHEVKQTQIQLRIENLCEHVNRRYQIDIREFQPDTYALLCSVRELNKKQRKTEDQEVGAEASAETAETPVAEEVENVVGETEREAIDWERIEALVKELDQRLESMGPINMEAIQEYDELEQRHAFLEQQFTDLTNSKTELLDVIAKINVTTRELFADTFEKIRVNFAEMFVELFGGGKANLVLTDESDPLESGIDIIAKPPGKQLQSISLLSGGEKTMTAVALLFSIYMVKPSPFCVLDEMDAPLDESNISRFVKILDRFVKQSQFVVITHNKRTIARADVLYGVTMEEHGISKLVGVKFSKREQSHEGNDILGTNNATPVPSVAESFGKSGDLHSETAAGA